MRSIITFLYKGFRKVYFKFLNYFEKFLTVFVFYINNVNFSKFSTTGVPFVIVSEKAKLTIGLNFRMHNILRGNPIGRSQKCVFFVGKGANLKIGNNVGISQAAIVSHKNIEISDNVKIGCGVCIYDTDFHSLDFSIRENALLDIQNKVDKAVYIKKNVFIGAHSTILKGVVIGENSIVGACSVVTKNIPSNEIWAGNPAKFIKKIEAIK